jgi:hypothetical protein
LVIPAGPAGLSVPTATVAGIAAAAALVSWVATHARFPALVRLAVVVAAFGSIPIGSLLVEAAGPQVLRWRYRIHCAWVDHRPVAVPVGHVRDLAIGRWGGPRLGRL